MAPLACGGAGWLGRHARVLPFTTAGRLDSERTARLRPIQPRSLGTFDSRSGATRAPHHRHPRWPHSPCCAVSDRFGGVAHRPHRRHARRLGARGPASGDGLPAVRSGFALHLQNLPPVCRPSRRRRGHHASFPDHRHPALEPRSHLRPVASRALGEHHRVGVVWQRCRFDDEPRASGLQHPAW